MEKENPAITEYMLQLMRETGPWTRFLSIIGFITVGIMLLVGLVMVLGLSFLPRGTGGPAMAFMGIFYMASSLLYLFPSLYLFKYASAVKRLRESGQSAVEDALLYQKSFWKFVGIVTIIAMIFAVLGVIAAIALPVFLAVRGM